MKTGQPAGGESQGAGGTASPRLTDTAGTWGGQASLILSGDRDCVPVGRRPQGPQLHMSGTSVLSSTVATGHRHLLQFKMFLLECC